VCAPFDAIQRHWGYLHRIKGVGETPQLAPKVNIRQWGRRARAYLRSDAGLIRSAPATLLREPDARQQERGVATFACQSPGVLSGHLDRALRGVALPDRGQHARRHV